MLPAPRTGSKCAEPKKTAWRATAATAPIRARKPRITTPRNTISSTSGAATTAVIASAIDVGAVGVDVRDTLGVARQGDVEGDDQQRDGDLHDERRDPDERTPAGVAPLEPQPHIGTQLAGPPAAADIPAPRDRRSVPHGRQQRDVHDERPLEAATACRSTTGHPPTMPTGLQVHRPPRRAGGTGAARPAGRT